MRTVEVVAYDDRWPELFREEAAKIREALGGAVRDIHHIGSTSVPGMAAKPIIDILVEVDRIENVDARSSRMESLGYEARGENGIPGRRYFCKGGDKRTHHVHVFQQGSGEVIRLLAFREYLTAHPAEAAAYRGLKLRLAERCSADVAAYVAGKDAFVKELQQRALSWWSTRRDSEKYGSDQKRG
ncbi:MULTISPECIES: GrpB family protein [Brevibacillus]|jgi:GrpB-like predicted nucleotidyltransferase (UPF0157 family)|uniref:GrpB family protein n=1 Tax=Brevibacillus aydinogluensis TaxID=927786 RepID=A0AA48M547_9BACL|nr:MULTISPECIES: GrpB family protein [Brevibacillus]REK65241.1 MAG: hypothetical protein DF221_06695 [Brevibacillus sp.]MBR8658786.1 GrpB family protein [Brevibacillus sp. NL20B1]MDT3415899.1 GrpB-like predicted nucleotidyltransferase (UPF0157 family) [Brevibacillus aydinogluensis]NNV04463.1 GrpB family protein [Brevibacillus sp. MCWH]CAJ1001462.1 GrpB family protein [Brevibacillus aydinogluensis]